MVFGSATFDPVSRRISGSRFVRLIVKDGKFVIWDGVKPETN